MTMRLSQAIRSGALGRKKMIKDYFPKDSFGACCAIGAAMLSSYGEVEVERVRNHFSQSHGAILNDRIQTLYPIMLETRPEAVTELHSLLLEHGSAGLLAAGEQGIGELIILANDESSITFNEIAQLIENAENNLAHETSSEPF